MFVDRDFNFVVDKWDSWSLESAHEFHDTLSSADAFFIFFGVAVVFKLGC